MDWSYKMYLVFFSNIIISNMDLLEIQPSSDNTPHIIYISNLHEYFLDVEKAKAKKNEK